MEMRKVSPGKAQISRDYNFPPIDCPYDSEPNTIYGRPWKSTEEFYPERK